MTGAGAAAFAGFAGCLGDNGDDGDSTDGSDTTDDSDGGSERDPEVELWTQETQEERIERLNDIANAFLSENAGAIDVQGVPSGDYISEFFARQAADDLFTVSQISVDQVAPLRGTGIPDRDLHQEVIDRVGEERDYVDFFLELFTDEDGLMAIPAFTWTKAMWYRESIFEDAGLDFVPQSFDQIMEAAETLHDPDNGQWGVGIGLEPGELYTQQCYMLFALANDAPLFSPDGEIIFDSDEHVETLEYYADLAEFTSPGLEGNTFIEYGNGDCHLTTVAPHILGYIWDIAETPEEDINDIRHSGYVEERRRTAFGLTEGTYMIYEGAEDVDKQAAADFIEYLLIGEDGDQYQNWLDIQIGGFQPVFEGYTESDAYRSNEIIGNMHASTLEAIESSLTEFERFGGYIHGEYFPVVGDIENQFLIADAVHDVVAGEDARTVAENYAEQMRQLQD